MRGPHGQSRGCSPRRAPGALFWTRGGGMLPLGSGAVRAGVCCRLEECVSAAGAGSVERNGVPMRVRADDPLAGELKSAIQGGDVDGLQRLLDAHPGLAAARIEGRRGGAGTALLMAADWPGFFPNGARVVAALIAAGGDVNDRGEQAGGGPGNEAPLHWAASSDDAEVAEALIDGGAEIDLPGGSIGTPLANAVGYGCWQVADLLVARGARIATLWEAAALGKMARIEELFASSPAPTAEEIHQAFNHACCGGQPRAAAYLLARGADPRWTPDYAKDRTAAEAAAGGGTRWGILRDWLKERGLTSGER